MACTEKVERHVSMPVTLLSTLKTCIDETFTSTEWCLAESFNDECRSVHNAHNFSSQSVQYKIAGCLIPRFVHGLQKYLMIPFWKYAKVVS